MTATTASPWRSAPRWSSPTCPSSSGSARSTTCGFAVEIWDWTQQGPGRARRDRRALHVDDRVRRGQPDRPRRRRRPAAHRRAVDRRGRPRSARRTSTCTAPGSTADGLPVRPVEMVTGAMWLAAVRTLRADRRARRARGCGVLPGEPQHRGRPPRHAVRQGGRHPRAGRGRRQPAPADEPRPLPRPDRRGEPDRADPRQRRPASARSRSRTCPAAASRGPARSTTRRSPPPCTRSATPAWSASRPGPPATPAPPSGGFARPSPSRRSLEDRGRRLRRRVPCSARLPSASSRAR